MVPFCGATMYVLPSGSWAEPRPSRLWISGILQHDILHFTSPLLRLNLKLQYRQCMSPRVPKTGMACASVSQWLCRLYARNP